MENNFTVEIQGCTICMSRANWAQQSKAVANLFSSTMKESTQDHVRLEWDRTSLTPKDMENFKTILGRPIDTLDHPINSLELLTPILESALVLFPLWEFMACDVAFLHSLGLLEICCGLELYSRLVAGDPVVTGKSTVAAEPAQKLAKLTLSTAEVDPLQHLVLWAQLCLAVTSGAIHFSSLPHGAPLTPKGVFDLGRCFDNLDVTNEAEVGKYRTLCGEGSALAQSLQGSPQEKRLYLAIYEAWRHPLDLLDTSAADLEKGLLGKPDSKANVVSAAN